MTRLDNTTVTADRFAGCLLGLATGDALGAPHEGGVLERLVWRLIGRTRDGHIRWTDDTQMALDLARSLLDKDGVDAPVIARRFASSYRWSRGYGPGAARVLKRIRRGEDWETASKVSYPEGSYGNGAAMRAPVLALFFPSDREALVNAARCSARVTHAHPLGIEGAILIGLTAQALLQGEAQGKVLGIAREECAAHEIVDRLNVAASWIETDASPDPREVSTTLGNGMTAPTSCPTALYIALRHLDRSFEEMMRFTIECGGDVDTIGSMAGALWGIANGASRLPPARLEARDTIETVASKLFDRYLSIGT